MAMLEKVLIANRGEIARMKQKDAPTIADPFVKIDDSPGAFRREIRSDIAQSQCHARVSGLIVWFIIPPLTHATRTVFRPVGFRFPRVETYLHQGNTSTRGRSGVL